MALVEARLWVQVRRMSPTVATAFHPMHWRARLGALPAPTRAAAAMVGACVIWGAITIVVRDLSANLHPFEIVFFRTFFGLVAIAPFMFRAGVLDRLGEAARLYFWRVVVGLTSMLTWFYAITKIPLAEATALSFMTPIFATVAAIVFLREVVRLRRWTATLIGFGGALLVLRPGVSSIGIGEITAVASALAGALATVLVKMLSRTEATNRVVAINLLFLTPLALIPALFVWTWPTPTEWLWLAGMGFAATAANWLTVRAFALGDTTAVLPYDFTRLPFVALLAFLLFGEVPDLWTWVGGGIIFLSSFYIARREAQIRKRDRDAATTTKVT